MGVIPLAFRSAQRARNPSQVVGNSVTPASAMTLAL